MRQSKTANWLALMAAWLLLASSALAQAPVPSPPPWLEPGADGQPRVHLYFFWSESCPHCQEAHPFVTAIPGKRPWVELHSLEVSRQRDNARRFVVMAEAIGQRAEAVPTLMFCGRMEVGWDAAATSGAALLAALDACRTARAAVPDEAAASASGGAIEPPAKPQETPAGAANPAVPITLPIFGTLDPSALSLPLFTIAIAGLDAFNPCAFFVLLFLLSLLAHQKDRRRMLLVGGIFVATSGLMYFAFMAAWLNVFQWLGALGGITLAAGLLAMLVGLINVKDFFAFEKGVSLSIPESAKPTLYRRARAVLQTGSPAAMLAATVLLAVAANFYELLCTAGFPMVYTRLLTLTVPSPEARYAWLALYNLIYVAPLLLIVLTFVGTLSAHKLSEREGRLLKLMSGTMMLELGLVLTLAPAWLNSLVVTAALVGGALAVTLLAVRLSRPAGKPE